MIPFSIWRLSAVIALRLIESAIRLSESPVLISTTHRGFSTPGIGTVVVVVVVVVVVGGAVEGVGRVGRWVLVGRCVVVVVGTSVVVVTPVVGADVVTGTVVGTVGALVVAGVDVPAVVVGSSPPGATSLGGAADSPSRVVL